MTTPKKRSYNWTRSVNLPSTVYGMSEIVDETFPDIKSKPVGSIILEQKYKSIYTIDHRHKLTQLIDINTTTYMISDTDEAMHMVSELSQCTNIDVLMDDAMRLITIYDHISGNVHTIKYGVLEAINAD